MLGRMTLAFGLPFLWANVASAQLSAEQVGVLLAKVDRTLAVPTDFHAVWAVVQKLSDGEEKVYQFDTYRRDAEESLVVLATKPRTEAGKGFLRSGKNLWF